MLRLFRNHNASVILTSSLNCSLRSISAAVGTAARAAIANNDIFIVGVVVVEIYMIFFVSSKIIISSVGDLAFFQGCRESIALAGKDTYSSQYDSLERVHTANM